MNTLLTLIEKLGLHIKLIIGFGLGLLIALIIGINSIQSMQAMSEKTQQILEMEMLGISHIKEANINLVYMGRSLRHMMLAQTPEDREKARTQLDLAILTLGKELGEAKTRISRKEEKLKFDEFDVLFDQYKRTISEVIVLLEKDNLRKSEASSLIFSDRFQKTINAADDTLTAITKTKEKGAQETAEALERMSHDSIQLSLTLLVLGLVFGSAFGMLIGRSVSNPIDQLRASIEGLASGHVDQAVPYLDYKNELGAVARSLSALQNTVREMEDSRWIKAHTSEISAVLQQAEDLRKLTQSAISRIAQVLSAGHGAFYVLSGENQLSLLASYGYRERKHINSHFLIGEGLVGQCAMEKLPILLTAPQDYIQINSGLGEAPPACISVLPIIHDNRVLGVLEIASFQQFTRREIALLDALVPALATTMEIMDRNQRTRDLLVATQEQAERMEKQAAQLEEQTVEMEAQQAELLETENWFRSIIESAPDGMLVSNESALIVLANPSVEALFGYANGELVGTPLSNILPAEAFSRHQQHSAIVQGINKDGQPFNVELNISQLPSRGRHGHCASIALRAA